MLIANLDHETGQEYVLVARSRGLTEAKMFVRHLVKPSMLPAMTMVAMIVGELMGGAIITEEVFGRNGIGTVMYQAVSTRTRRCCRQSSRWRRWCSWSST